MKHILVFFSVMSLVLFLSSCKLSDSAQTPIATANSSPNVQAEVDLDNVDLSAVLSGYSIELLPPYACNKVMSCTFDTQEHIDYDIGMGTYTLAYESYAAKEEIFSFYNSIMTTKDEQYNKNWVTGSINDTPVAICVLSGGKSSEVSLIYSQEIDDETNPNPYFEKYPNIVIALGEGNKLQTTSYELFNSGNMLERFSIEYESTLSFDEFTLLYENAYKNNSGFVFTEDGSTKDCSFTIDNYSYDIALRKDGSEEEAGYLTIMCTLKKP